MSSAPTSTATCAICGGAGYYLLAVKYGQPGWGEPQRCSCMPPLETAATRAAARASREAARMRGELGRYADCTFATFRVNWPTKKHTVGRASIEPDEQKAQLAAALAGAKAYAGRLQGWVYLYGTYGGGKSHLAAAILNDAAERGVVGGYASAADLLRHIHDGFADHSASERLRTLATMPLLVVDDLKDEYLAGGRAAETLWELLNPRYRDSLPTVITSNVHRDELPDLRISSRIAEMVRADLGGAEIILTVSDYRRRGDR